MSQSCLVHNRLTAIDACVMQISACDVTFSNVLGTFNWVTFTASVVRCSIYGCSTPIVDFPWLASVLHHLWKTKKYFLTKFHWYNIVGSKVSLLHRLSVYNFHRIHTILHKYTTISVHDRCMLQSRVECITQDMLLPQHHMVSVLQCFPLSPPVCHLVKLLLSSHIELWACVRW